ncbi:MAG: DNA-directed RNA polymerase subunit beta, partial [Alistipes sp.]|nr:DNA-directed RNA polymerase subunit beta [Alistipes sp.]
LSALGPGGLSRDRAGFEVRDVHYTHYGRLCPIESPEGPNIGLISSLCVYAKISDMGFLETPYRSCENGVVDMDNSHIRYYSAEEEEGQIIAQAGEPLTADNRFVNDGRIKARLGADFPVVHGEEVNLVDVAPNQIASIAASLIPFLEHDDANRALMGSNMMRQAVPLVRCESPIVGTGIEKEMISDSRIQIVAEGDGVVEFADATVIKVRYDRSEEEVICSFAPEVTIYNLPRYRRTNQDTSVTLKPAVLTGERVVKGQILTEGYSTEKGELALGRNLKVAFMPWKGYNFEDAIVISERIQREDIFTSVHVSEYITEVRDTKRGVEELTSDIPNVSEEATRNLDENGIIRIGANIKPGDILIGKITPKGESDPSPEEKLLRAIFGDKAGDVKDASLKANPSLQGVVIDTKLYSRASKVDKKGRAAEKLQLEKLDHKFADQVADLTKILVSKLWTLLQGKTTTGIKDYFGVELYAAGAKFTQKMLDEIANKTIDEKTHIAMGYLNLGDCNWTDDAHLNELITKTVNNYTMEVKKADANIKRERSNLTNGDEITQPGVIQMAKVYIAKRRKLKVGDKMAGRHGNKGIVAKVVRDEDMPFLEDGTIVDICLNPLGVPSRMNLGQIYETVLGWAGRELGLKFATPIFDGASLEQINEYTDKAGLPRTGRCYLYDGGTGERFDQPATVGVIYMLKLGHMIDDKMHARSIGPYSLITQQPLGGKAQFGGQRFGEMEVWALEGFGAANILQEILTVKSDDVMGRAKVYEAIVKGDNLPKPGIPEAMNVLLHELRGLGLSVTLE